MRLLAVLLLGGLCDAVPAGDDDDDALAPAPVPSALPCAVELSLLKITCGARGLAADTNKDGEALRQRFVNDGRLAGCAAARQEQADKSCGPGYRKALKNEKPQQDQCGQPFLEYTCTPCEVDTWQPDKGFKGPLCRHAVAYCGRGGQAVDKQLTGRSDRTCRGCPPGQYGRMLGYFNKDGGCWACDNGKYQNIYSSSACIPQPTCHPGFRVLSGASSTARRTCEACPAGRYEDGTNVPGACKVCPVGQYQNNVGQGACRDCETGRFQTQTEQPDCTDCAAGTFAAAPARGTACQACTGGQYQERTGKAGCVGCEIGRFGDAQRPVNSDEHCQKCAMGHFQDEAGREACKAWSPTCPHAEEAPPSRFADRQCGIVHCPFGSWAVNPQVLADCQQCDATPDCAVGHAEDVPSCA